MKKKILSLVLALLMVLSFFPGMAMTANAADTADEGTYIPLAVSGFNKDVVVEKEQTITYGSNIGTNIATPFDGENDGAHYALYEEDGNNRDGGLPSDRTVGSGMFTLQPYNQNNVLQLYGTSASTAKGSLTFTVQTGYPMIAFLGAGGNGAASFKAKITYTDNTTSDVLTSTAPDWYISSYDGFKDGPFGRVKIQSDDQTTAGNMERVNGPNLYAFTIETNQFKAIKSIDFEYTGGDNMRLNIMAVSGIIPANTYSVAFDANGGGTGSVVTATGVTGQYTLPANGFTPKEGYTFVGWSTSQSGGTLLQPGEPITVNSNVTLYAQWQKPAVENPGVDVYIPLSVSGFNYDVVVEKGVALNSSSYGTYAMPFDGENSGAYYALYEEDVNNRDGGLPSDRTVGSGMFTLQPYNQNNVLQLYGTSASTAKGSLTFTVQTGYPMIAFLGAGGNGAASFKAKITYTDNTTSDVLTSTAPDWYLGDYSGFKSGPFGRIKIKTDDETSIGTMERSNGPNLYAFTIETNQFKAIKSIDFEYTGGDNMRLNIMAVSGIIPANTYSVAFDANGGGTGSMVTATGVAETYTLPENAFTPNEGYTFKGWATSVNGTVHAVGETIEITGDTMLYAQWREPDEGGEQNPDVELGTIVNLGDNCITVDGNTVTVNKPEGDDEYIYFLTVLPEIYLEGTGMTAEQYVERHMLGVDKSIIDATTLDLTDVPGIHELANTTQIFATNIETDESLDGYISGDSVVIVLKLHPDNVKVATYDSAADNPYFGSGGFTTAYAYGIYGVYATRVSAGAGAEVVSAELTFTYEETIGAIVAGEELPDLSVLAPEHVVVKDTDGNVLTVVDVDADWLCKAPDLDEGWGWPDSNIAQDGMEYGIRIEVIGDGSYSFGTSWDDLTVLTCQDEKLSVNSAWVGDPNSAFVAFIEMSTVQQPEPPHEHSYTYTSNNDGTHNGTCACGEDAITNELCIYISGACSKCGAVGTYSVTGVVKMETEDSDDPYKVCPDATVTLVSPDGTPIVQTKTDENGMYVFENVEGGIYNVRVTMGEKIKTVLVTVNKNISLPTIKLPLMVINSKVNVTVSDNSPVKGASAGGMDDLADRVAGTVDKAPDETISVEVAMKIDTKMSEQVDSDQKLEITDVAQDQSENLTFLDIKIDLTITRKKGNETPRTETGDIHNTGDFVEIVIPFNTANKDDFAVYRYHNEDNINDDPFADNVQKLTKNANEFGERIVVENGVIKMYVKYFSTYAIGYSETLSDDDDENDGEVDVPAVDEDEEEDETPEAPQTPVIPNIPAYSSEPSYRVNVAFDGEGGTVTVSGVAAAKGKTVTITVTPDKDYRLETLSVTDKMGSEIEVTHIGGNKYTFVMPMGRVDIDATFVQKETTCTRGLDCPIRPYMDASTTAWYHDGVHYCIENGLMNGMTTTQFAPNGTTTRAQIVTILWRLEGEPYANYAMSFADVAMGKWYTEAVRWAAANGIVDGYSATSFGPNDSITREQMAAILWRYCQYKGIDVSVGKETNILSYTDAFDVHSWAMDAMQWACGAGVIGGIADGNSMKLDPTGSATRAQVATMLQRFCTEIMEP